MGWQAGQKYHLVLKVLILKTLARRNGFRILSRPILHIITQEIFSFLFHFKFAVEV